MIEKPQDGQLTLVKLHEILDELVAAGLVEIKGMRDGKPVYVATDKEGHICEPPKAPK